jgi:hypothetical protein
VGSVLCKINHEYSNFFPPVAVRHSVGHGLFIFVAAISYITTHRDLCDSSGRVIRSKQRPLPDNTQHSQQTNIHAPMGFEPTISTGEQPQILALNLLATGIGI